MHTNKENVFRTDSWRLKNQSDLLLFRIWRVSIVRGRSVEYKIFPSDLNHGVI